MRKASPIFLLLFLAAIVGPISAFAQTTTLLTVNNSTWSYISNKTDNPPTFVPGDAWAATAFNDSSWPTGRGLFGREPDIGTYAPWTIVTYIANPRSDDGPNVAGSGPLSSYFRTHFTWSGTTANVTLRFTNYVDDGILVYLNGQELFSFNVPVDRPIPWDALTMPNGANPLGEGVPFITNIVDSPLLVAGDNVIAVALHQQANTTSDDVFGMSLTAVIPFAPINQNPGQPADRIITQNRSSILQVFASGAPDPTYQWFVGGVPIPDATNATLLVTNDTAIASTSNFFARVTNPLGTFDSRTAVVTFMTDTVPPTLVRAVPNATFNQIRVEFSEVVDPTTSQDGFNYGVSGGISLMGEPVLSPSGKSVILNLAAPMSPDTLYTVTVSGVFDLANLVIAPASTIQFRSWVPTSAGGWVFEAFNGTPGPINVGLIQGNTVANLTSHPSYPNSPSETFLLPGTTTRLAGAGYDADLHDLYGGRVRGLFFPPESGNWVFILSPDDGGELYLNTNGPSATGKTLIAQQTGCCNLFNVAGAFRSAPIPLVGGQPYYIEGLYKEGIGGDYLHVASVLDGAPLPTDGGANGCASCNDPSVVGSGAMPAGAAGTFTITQQPASAQVIAAMPATLSVGVNQSLGLPVLYQWRRNGAPIAGANQANYTFVPSLADDNAQFSVAVTNLGGAGQLSASATLDVVPDTFAPTLVSSTPAADGTGITLVFSEGMHALAAADAFNYKINGTQVTSATLSADSKTVTVVYTSPVNTPCAANVLVITDVTDIAGNLLAPNPTTVNYTLPLTLTSLTSTWKYNDSGTDLGTAWREPGFNDSAWLSGGSLLGFEPAATQVPMVVTALSSVITNTTAYFRAHFNLGTDPRAIIRLQLREILDDGAVYYFNGVEAHRTRMPTGAITATTLASAGGPEPTDGTHTVEGPTDLPLPTAGLVFGDNVVAVEVHPSSITSSDAVFAAELLATVSSCGPALNITSSGSMATLTWSDPTYNLQSAPDVLGPWAAQAGASGVMVSTASGNRFFRLVKP